MAKESADKPELSTEQEAWKLFSDLGIDPDDLPLYTNPTDFGRGLLARFPRQNFWVASQSSSSLPWEEGVTA